LSDNKIFIILGKQGSGKTTFLEKLVDGLAKSGVHAGGFVAQGMWSNKKRTGFNLKAIKDGQTIRLCSVDSRDGYNLFGQFWFNPEAIKLGHEIIMKESLKSDIMVIDEIGIFELQENIWFDSFMYLLNETSTPAIITVREKIISDVIDKFGLKKVSIFNNKDSITEIIDLIMDNLSLHQKLQT
jgi:nucleoside-triphosphatase THEP1